eukprot:COSAG03_NODE_1486_length_3996_cov_7.419040_1_plen_45_part_00
MMGCLLSKDEDSEHAPICMETQRMHYLFASVFAPDTAAIIVSIS